MHGFKVDRNAPWRLVANLESRTMAKYMSKYKIYSLAELFDSYYVKTYLDDISDLKDILYDFYKFYVGVDPSFDNLEWCVEGQKVIKRTFRRQTMRKNSFFEKYGDKYWMRIWFMMRLYELGVELEDRVINVFLTTAYKIKKTLDLSAAMDYLNSNLMKLSGRGGPPSKAFVERTTDRQIIIKK